MTTESRAKSGCCYILALVLWLVATLTYALASGPTVIDASGKPLATGMGWDVKAARPTDAQILASSLGQRIEALRGRAQITPADLGDDSADDDTGLLQWSLLASRVLRVPLWIDRQYGYSDVLEVQEGQTVYGNGPHAPGLRMLPGRWFANPDFGWPKRGVAAIVHAPGVRRFTLRDLQIDGGQQDVDWRAVAASPHAATIRRWLQDSPSWGGVCPHPQDGRNLPDEVTLENVHIHDTPGACLHAHAWMRCRNLTLGNSVGNRPLYGFHGHCFGLRTYGFTPFSVGQIYSGTIVGWTHRDEGHRHPWPEIEQPTVVAQLSRPPQWAGARIELLNVDWDGAGGKIRAGFDINTDCRVTGSIRNMGSFSTSPTNRGPYTIDADLVCENSTPPNLAAYSLANVSNARIRWINRTTDRDPVDTDWSYTGPATAIWHRLLHNAVQISVARKPWHAPDHEQRIDLHLDSDWPTTLVLQLPDLAINDGGTWRLRTPDEVVPTYVHVSGRIDNRGMAQWIATQAGWSMQYRGTRADLERLPIRVVFDGLSCNRIPPGPFRGDHRCDAHEPLTIERLVFPLATSVGKETDR